MRFLRHIAAIGAFRKNADIRERNSRRVDYAATNGAQLLRREIHSFKMHTTIQDHGRSAFIWGFRAILRRHDRLAFHAKGVHTGIDGWELERAIQCGYRAVLAGSIGVETKSLEHNSAIACCLPIDAACDYAFRACPIRLPSRSAAQIRGDMTHRVTGVPTENDLQGDSLRRGDGELAAWNWLAIYREAAYINRFA